LKVAFYDVDISTSFFMLPYSVANWKNPSIYYSDLQKF